MYERKALFLTLMNSSFNFFSQALFLFSYYYKRSITNIIRKMLLLHNFPLIYYTHVLLSVDVMTYDVSCNI